MTSRMLPGAFFRVVSKEVGDELEYEWLDARQEVLACHGEDGPNSVYGDG